MRTLANANLVDHWISWSVEKLIAIRYTKSATIAVRNLKLKVVTPGTEDTQTPSGVAVL